MPAMLDDPTAPPIYRTSGELPYPTPHNNEIPSSIEARYVTLRDRITTATLLPFSSAQQVPPGLLSYMADQLNREIEKGDTYPMLDPMPVETFGKYWFQNFGAIMVTGEIEDDKELLKLERNGVDWGRQCLGSFYVKPNYPGRSSHVCNSGFLVTDAARNKGVGRLMGECYLDWAPKLGYTYSVFNLVYETNVASCRIWDALGFKRIGRVKGCGALRSYPDEMIDAIIYGRDLGPEGDDYVAEERFDKIRYYLKHGKYPPSADRAEKSRLRSAATHYKLLPPAAEGEEDRLMLKDKEVISDPQKQYDIARTLHLTSHGGINKTTATVAEKYHWVRIKDTVSLVIKNCSECKETNKIPNARVEAAALNSSRRSYATNTNSTSQNDPNQEIERLASFEQRKDMAPTTAAKRQRRSPLQDKENSLGSPLGPQLKSHFQPPALDAHAPMAPMQESLSTYHGLPVDPQIMQYSSQSLSHSADNDGLSMVSPSIQEGEVVDTGRMSADVVDEAMGKSNRQAAAEFDDDLMDATNLP